MYDNLNDYELVSQAQELNEDAINILNEKLDFVFKKIFVVVVKIFSLL